MRVVIFCDMEGVANIQTWSQVSAGKAFYEECRKLYTDEANAAVRGAKAAGATEIIVIDGHGAGGDYSFNSFVADRMESGAQYVTGYRWGRYIEAFEQGCDALLFVGAHAMSGTPTGVLCHTVSTEAWHNAWINDIPIGESGIIAAIAGSWDVPAVFASGDVATCQEVQQIIGDGVVTAQVKVGLGRYAARNLAPQDACALIEARSAEALRNRGNWPKPLKFGDPVTFKVELAVPDAAAEYRGRPGVVIEAPRLITSTGPSFWDAWNQFWYRY
jgi:D-amino peptidase